MKGLTPDEIIELLASTPARDEGDKELRRKAQEHVAAKREADREDRSLKDRLDEMTLMRDRAVDWIVRYDRAINEVADLLGEDHEAVQRLRAAQAPKPEPADA